MPRVTLSPGRLAQLACILEVTARKPGNVHRYCDFADATYLDFLLSAAAIADPLDRAAEWGVGMAVLRAVEATRATVATNTNLGMVLLLAPLAAVPADIGLREGIVAVLEATTVEDTRHVYRAIRAARPGGLGHVPDQDVAEVPTVTLGEAMRLARDRDLVARQYAGGFDDVFLVSLPALVRARPAGGGLETAIVASFLETLAASPDTLIARKRGPEEAEEASRRARAVLDAGWPETGQGRAAIGELDAWLRAVGHGRNPGATADVVCAALFAALRDGTISLPLPAGTGGWSGS